jgi:two-component system LytT family response regulator
MRKDGSFYSGCILVTKNGKTHVKRISSIVNLSADGAYTNIHFDDQGIILFTKSLKYFECILSKDQFFRCHNSHIINLERFTDYNNINRHAVLDCLEIPVARRRLRKLFLAVAKYKESQISP